MKKIIAIVFSFVIVLTCVSCKKDTNTLSSDINEKSNVESIANDTEDTVSQNTATQTESTSNESVPEPTSSEKQSVSSKETVSTQSNKQPDKQTESSEESNLVSSAESQQPTVSEEIDSSTEEKIEEEIPNDIIGGDEESDIVLGVDYGAFLYEGTFISVVDDKNITYSIFRDPNAIAAYDVQNFEMLYTTSLPGKPAEIQVEGNNLYISYPDLKCIKVYNKTTFSLIESISLPNVVSSFCIDGDLVYYSEHDQHCKVYCTNLQTKETKMIKNGNVSKSFYFPKLALNKELGLLYIGESGSTGSALYYYNTSDLSLHSVFKKDNYGLTNQKRTLFYVGNNVFWGGFRFGADSAENIIGSYSGNSIYYADQNFVITVKGIYDTESYQYLGTVEHATHMAVTENQTLITVFSHYPGKVVVVVPY